ncbi:MAG: hypothetical protein KKA07_17055 [Bacteroidetes bacterium]|nr:hypothetical protein [Bacteroidota bacterium]MBU1720777.1 hypothetical protein [Bacteroidota bacterium]
MKIKRTILTTAACAFLLSFSLPSNALYHFPTVNNFNVDVSTKSVNLTWNGLGGNDAVYFVEKSVDGINFDKVEEIKSTKDNGSSFKCADKYPERYYTYYRIRILTPDGQSVYSEIRMIYAGPEDFNSIPDDLTIA